MARRDPSRYEFPEIDGYKIFTRTWGHPEARRTLLCVHGGPGATHDYLTPMADLAGRDLRVVLYDALGCGRSDLPEGTALFTVEHDLEVLDGIREWLGEDRIHLMGSSYGGLLTLAYAVRHSDHLTSLNATGGLTDVPFARREMRRLVEKLPRATREIMRKYERRGEYFHPEYTEAIQLFYRRHVCRLWPWPPDVVATLSGMSRTVYETMNGPNEFTITGRIKDLDFKGQLHRISVPTLLIHGRYDEVTPAIGQQSHRRIPGSALRIFPRSSHTSFWEERAGYMRLVREFLGDAERAERGS